MYKLRRDNYLKYVDQGSLSFFFSGVEIQRSQDANYPFSVDRNFYYLTGINQANVVLVSVKGEFQEESFLFIEPFDPIKALWDGAGLSFEEAANISEIPLKNIRAIDTLDQFVANLLSTSRRAIFGDIKTAYLDLDRLKPSLPDRESQAYAKQLTALYPYILIKPNQSFLARLRTVKNKEEVERIKAGIAITKEGLNTIMDNLSPGAKEFEVEAAFNYVLNKNRAIPGFTSICASGKNATVLHYIENNDAIKDGDLVLFDLGACKDLYSADISRTYPANGKFTKRQREIYEVVLEANKKTIEWLKPGVSMAAFNQYGKNILIEGAKKLGLIEKDEDILKYYYHSLGHYLGLDIHDVGRYSEPIPVGSVITVEPGLYIAEEGIGIRIEDDILVTEDGCINLSRDIIKEVDDIEAYMAKK